MSILVAAKNSDIHLSGGAAAKTAEGSVLQDVEQFGLHLRAHSPISSSKRVPLLANSNFPGLDFIAPVKAPAS
jgi:hypothetical protein